MKTITAFIAESGPYVRRQLEDAIHSTDDIYLANSMGTEDIEKTAAEILRDEPDLLLLGIDHIDSQEMELFYRIRKQLAYLPIIVFVPHNKFGAAAAIEAVKKGAVEYFPKTTAFTGRARTLDYFINRVIPVMKATSKLNRTVLLTTDYMDKKLESADPIPADFFKMSMSRMQLLVIAGCLGGIAPLYILLSKLPENFPVPILVLQHIEDLFSELLADDLNRYTKFDVKEAKDGDQLQKGVALLAPGNFHIKVLKISGKSTIKLNQNPDVAGFRPSIDLLLDSVAKQYGPNTLTVFLSGGGGDGTEGAKVIDVIGGQIIVQNKQSSLLSDFNWKLHVHGIHEGSYPIERLAHEIAKRVR